MNFERFTSRVKASAQAAAVAARNFKGFDEMAANDEYIHSEDLNVGRRQKPQTKPQAAEEGSSLPTTPKRMVETTVAQQERSPLLSIHAQSEDSDDENDDPILKVIRSSKTSANSSVVSERRMDPLEMAGGDDQSEHSTFSERSGRRKNKNRFMEELEDRLSKPLEIAPPSPPPSEEPSLSPQAKGEAPSSSWLFSLVNKKTPQKQEKPSSSNAPLARRPRERPQNDLDNFHVVVSSNVLAEDELRQLQELKGLSETQPSPSQRLWLLVWEHPREGFIVMTLLLCIAAYYYAHFRTEDSVV